MRDGTVWKRVNSAWTVTFLVAILFLSPGASGRVSASPASRTVVIEVRRAAQSPGSLQQITDDSTLLLTVFADGHVISDNALYNVNRSRVDTLRTDLLANGVVASGRNTVGEYLTDLGDDIEIRVGDGQTTVGYGRNTTSLPASSIVDAFQTTLGDRGQAVPERLVHRHVIYTTSKSGIRLRCFPVSAARGARIRRAIADDGENAFYVDGRRVSDLAVVTSYGQPPRKLTVFHNTCKQARSAAVRITRT